MFGFLGILFCAVVTIRGDEGQETLGVEIDDGSLNNTELLLAFVVCNLPFYSLLARIVCVNTTQVYLEFV